MEERLNFQLTSSTIKRGSSKTPHVLIIDTLELPASRLEIWTQENDNGERHLLEGEELLNFALKLEDYWDNPIIKKSMRDGDPRDSIRVKTSLDVPNKDETTAKTEKLADLSPIANSGYLSATNNSEIARALKCEAFFPSASVSNVTRVTNYSRVIDLRLAESDASLPLVKVHCHCALECSEHPKTTCFFGATTAGSKAWIDPDPKTSNFPIVVECGASPSGDEHELIAKITFDCSKRVSNYVNLSYSINYHDAFIHRQDWWFHTHVDYPADEISIIVLFPEKRPCKRIQLFQSQTPSRSSDLIPNPTFPARFAGDTIAHFQIRPVAQGFTYKIQWEW